MRLAYLCTAWLLGIGIAWHWLTPFPLLLYTGLATAIAFLILILLKKLPLWTLWLPLLFTMALLRLLWSAPAGGTLPQLVSDSQSVEVQGVVVSDPEEQKNHLTFQLQTEEILVGGKAKEVSERLLVMASPPADLIQKRERPYLRYGDRLRLEGKLSKPEVFSSFDYPAYLANQGIQTILYYPRIELLEEGTGFKPLEGIFWLRSQLAKGLERTLPEPQGSFNKALLLGLRRDIPTPLMNAFALSGTLHILAVSGLQVAVVMGIAMKAIEILWGRRYLLHLLAPLLLIWVYTLLSGAAPSAVRAAVMGSLYLLALMLGRRASGANAILLAAALMVGLDPSSLGNISFQLSFAAIAGLIFLAPAIAKPMDQRIALLADSHPRTASTISLLWSATAISIAATIATLPLTAFHFHRVCLAGIPATLLLLPSFAPLLIGGVVSASLGITLPILGQIVGWGIWLVTSYNILVVNLFARLPVVWVDMGALGEPLVGAYYALLIAILWLTQIPHGAIALVKSLGLSSGTEGTGTMHRYRWHLAILGTATVLVWSFALTLPSDKLAVSFLDVGQGDSILISTPSGRQVLVDGGPDPQLLLQRLGETMPFWDKSIDLVVLTHPSQDHLAGLLGVLTRYEVGRAIENGFPDNSSLYTEWQKTITSKGIPVTLAERSQVVDLGKGATIEMLNPPETLIQGTSSDLNSNAIVLRLTYHEVSFLLTGDLSSEGESLLLDNGSDLRSSVLKVGHHGSKNATSPAFLAAVDPTVAVISVGAENPFGHPSPETIQRLRQAVGAERIYTTVDKGTIKLITDGERLWVKTTK